MENHFLASLKILVIDGNNTSRQSIINVLRGLGVSSCTGCPDIPSARKLLLSTPDYFDVLLTDMWFEGNAEFSGAAFLDEIKRTRICTEKTVLGIISSESQYSLVYDALSNGIDFYLIKPFKVKDLEERIKKATSGKRLLTPVLNEIRLQNMEVAADKAVQLYWEEDKMFIAKLANDLLLKSESYEKAYAFLKTLPSSESTLWTQIELARLDMRSQNFKMAEDRLKAAIGAYSDKAELHEALYHVYHESFKLKEATSCIKKAVDLSPYNISRLQCLGHAEFKQKNEKEAFTHLKKAFVNGKNSQSFNYSNLIVMGLIPDSFDKKRDFDLLQEHLKQKAMTNPKNARLTALSSVMDLVSCNYTNGNYEEASSKVIDLIKSPKLDLDAALSSFYTLDSVQKNMDTASYNKFVIEFSNRYAVSKNYATLLCHVTNNEQAKHIIENEYTKIAKNIQDIIEISSTEPRTALNSLIDLTKSTLNSKYIQTAYAILNRDKKNLDEIAYHEFKKSLDDLKNNAYFAGPCFSSNATDSVKNNRSAT